MMAFEVKRTSFPDDLPKMEEFVFNILLPDVPLLYAFNVVANSDSPHRIPFPYQPSPNSKDFCLKAVDSSGEMIGIAINKERADFTNDSNTPKEWIQVVECFKFIQHKSKLNSLPGKKIELLAIAVHRDWRNHSVARRLAEESMKIARAAGFTTMWACCGNEYSAKLARSLGWREHYRLPYKDYPRLSGANVTLKDIPYYDNIYLYETEL